MHKLAWQNMWEIVVADQNYRGPNLSIRFLKTKIWDMMAKAARRNLVMAANFMGNGRFTLHDFSLKLSHATNLSQKPAYNLSCTV